MILLFRSPLPTLAIGLVSSLFLVACASSAACPDVAAAPASVAAPASAAPASTATMAAPTAEDMTKAGATVDAFHAAAAAADEEKYFALFDEGGVFLGTDGKERWTVPQFRAYAHPRFATGKAWSFRSTHRDLTAHGDVVWFDEDLDTPNLGKARGSGVLVKNAGGDWKVAQYNLSVPIPNERFAEVKKVIESGAPAPATSGAAVGSASGAPPTTPPTKGPGGGMSRGIVPQVCLLARAARVREQPTAAALEAQCRAQGGTP